MGKGTWELEMGLNRDHRCEHSEFLDMLGPDLNFAVDSTGSNQNPESKHAWSVVCDLDQEPAFIDSLW